ncbi:MAG: phosphate--acyl-ACP acyltransferase, partial [Pseudomonadota bacterium]
AEAMNKMLEEEMKRSLVAKAGFFFCRRAFQKFNKKLDYAEYGGAPVLGINGIGIICHGSSSARAIKNAIKMAADYVQNNVLERLSLQLAEFSSKIG